MNDEEWVYYVENVSKEGINAAGRRYGKVTVGCDL